MKKSMLLRVLFLSCLIFALLIPAAALGETTVTQNNIKYSIDTVNKTAMVVTESQPTSKVITIPDTITYDGQVYPVTVIGEKAFMQKLPSRWTGYSYNEVYIGANVERIEDYAFGEAWDYLHKLQFNGDKCQTIASNAFDWIDLYGSFELIVKGDSGCMDTVLSGVADLKGSVSNIIYDNTSEELTNELQQQIDAAPDNEATEIKITKNIGVSKTIVIPENKIIILTDDGTQRTLTASITQNVGEMFQVKGSLTIDGDLVLKGGKSSGQGVGNIANVKGTKGKLILKKGTLTGGEITWGSPGGAVLLQDGASFEMSGGSIENFTFKTGTLIAPVVVGPGASFAMTGGTIQNNKNNMWDKEAPSSGGVVLYTWHEGDEPAKMEMSGTAKICQNYCYYHGGGIYMIGNTQLHMTGGTISGNTAGQNGGGISVAGTREKNETCEFIMDGGVIEDNVAKYSCGGGIYAFSDSITLNAGRIQNNTAYKHGGGVYVSWIEKDNENGGDPAVLQMYDALITGNTATQLGGGMWFCPAGDGQIYVTNGASIYGNTSDGAGDDFVSVGKAKGTVTLAQRMLGGGKVDWYADGAVEWANSTLDMLAWMEVGKAVEGVARFDPQNPGQSIVVNGSTANLALKAVASDEAKALAQSKAKLIVTGNKAAQGGGVGCNGNIVIGKPNETYSLRIEKEWDETTSEDMKTPVTLRLVINGYKLDEILLNKENEWTAKLEGLPQPDSMDQFTVVEEPKIVGFDCKVEEMVADGEKSFVIRVKNVRRAEEQPVNIPQTGDGTPLGLMLIMTAVSLVGLGISLADAKRRRT